MPTGKKRQFTTKQDRQIQHIIDSEVKSGTPKAIAENIAYGVVQKQKAAKKIAGKKKK